AIDPDAPAALLQGRDSAQQVRAIRTGLKAVDRMGIMEVLCYTRQLKRIAKGAEPRPGESGLAAFLKSALGSGWGTWRTRRQRLPRPTMTSKALLATVQRNFTPHLTTRSFHEQA